MPLRYYMDENIHDAITEGLRRRGIDVLRAQDDGHDETDDSIVLDRATSLDRIVFTNDSDFLVIARQRQTDGIDFAGVVFAKQKVVPIGVSVSDLETIALAYTQEEMANYVEYIPL